MAQNKHMQEQPSTVYKTRKPRFTYGIRLFICPICERKQHMKPDDKHDAIIHCTSCFGELKVIKNIEVDDDLFDCAVEKI